MAQAKRSNNMSFRSDRASNNMAGTINHMPPFATQHTYMLAALYPYGTEKTANEWAFQGEIRYTWKRKTVTNFTAKELLEPLFSKGKCVFVKKDVKDIRAYCAAQVETLWDEVTRFENPHNYYVDLSQPLWDLKHELLRKNGK